MVDEGFKLTNEQRAAAIERRAAAHALEHADRLWRFYADWREALEIEAGHRAAEFEAGRARARKMRRRAGAKISLSGPSKSRKTFSQMHLAVCVATGSEWFGHKCGRDLS